MNGTQEATKTNIQLDHPRLYNVIILNDDHTPIPFVIQLIIEIFNRSISESKQLTTSIHEKGSAIVGTYTHEIAEQKMRESQDVSRQNGYPLQIIIEPDED